MNILKIVNKVVVREILEDGLGRQTSRRTNDPTEVLQDVDPVLEGVATTPKCDAGGCVRQRDQSKCVINVPGLVEGKPLDWRATVLWQITHQL